MPKMLYADDPDFYEKPGTTVDIPLGAGLTRSRSYVVPALPWQNQPRQTLPEQPLTERQLPPSQLDSESLTLDQQAIAKQAT